MAEVSRLLIQMQQFLSRESRGAAGKATKGSSLLFNFTCSCGLCLPADLDGSWRREVKEESQICLSDAGGDLLLIYRHLGTCMGSATQG